jgi:hypothetical protein
VSALQGRSVEFFEETFQLLIDGRQKDEEDYDDSEQGNGCRRPACGRSWANASAGMKYLPKMSSKRASVVYAGDAALPVITIHLRVASSMKLIPEVPFQALRYLPRKRDQNRCRPGSVCSFGRFPVGCCSGLPVELRFREELGKGERASSCTWAGDHA